MALYAGTSGWAYKEWRGAFYPERLPQARLLEHYGAVLTACEVNATFYRTQSASAVAAWAAAVPEGFRFAIKVHRMLTYRKQMELSERAQELMSESLASIAELGPKLGCLLVQVPPFVERDDEALGGVLGVLPRGVPFACEFHNPSWQGDDVEEMVAAAGGTLCVLETEGRAPERLPAGPVAYLRLKGARYPDPERAALLDLLHGEAAERDVYAFAKHKEVAADDPYTGLGLARWLVGSEGDG
jgi:uncharacterized protein YecE (DUF72 family)